MSSVRKHFSLEAANFSLFSQEGEVTSSLIPGPAWSLRLQFTKYQQRYAPMNFFYLFIFFFFFCSCLNLYYTPSHDNALRGIMVSHWLSVRPSVSRTSIHTYASYLPRLAFVWVSVYSVTVELKIGLLG